MGVSLIYIQWVLYIVGCEYYEYVHTYIVGIMVYYSVHGVLYINFIAGTCVTCMVHTLYAVGI